MNQSVLIKEAVNKLCKYNDRTRHRVAGDIYLGTDILIVTLVPDVNNPARIIDVHWETVDRTYDIIDLINDFDAEKIK